MYGQKYGQNNQPLSKSKMGNAFFAGQGAEAEVEQKRRRVERQEAGEYADMNWSGYKEAVRKEKDGLASRTSLDQRISILQRSVKDPQALYCSHLAKSLAMRGDLEPAKFLFVL